MGRGGFLAGDPRTAGSWLQGSPPVDGAAAVFRGSDLIEVVAGRAGAHGYRMSYSGETRIESRLLC